MLLSPLIQRLQRDVRAIAQLGDERTREVADSLSIAMESAIRTALIEALTLMSQEVSRGSLSLDGDTVTIVSTPEGHEAIPATDRSARIALRLPEDLKREIETSAERSGLSVNSWIVNALHDSVRRKKQTPTTSGKTVRGRGRA